VRRRLVALLVTLLASMPAAALADTIEPTQWPSEIALGSAPNALRFGGVDRYWTSTAMALALRGAGELPYDSPDPLRGATSLAEADDWWGAATCPRSVIIVAGDTPADAIAAASLSDPTNRSDEPRLERVAASDPFFDPIGGFDRVDTASAPIIATGSARERATSLAPSARLALSDLRAGGCTDAREAIIVGGSAAVPTAVEGELLSLGYDEVFRVAGIDRFDTAARIATSLGTEPVPAGADCVDERTDDGSTAMSFYANSVIEYRPRDDRGESCELHGRTVVLADGIVGADALAAGWWTSYWQVPVLLTAGDGSLPPATRTALQTMAIDTIIVLGGTGRIPLSTEAEASRLAGAVVGRFAGADRYETSVHTAQAFGGWFPSGDPEDTDGDRVCVAASTGALIGWPDALAAGPLCGRLAAAAATVRSPSRVAEPVATATGAMVPGRSSHDAVPLILIPGGADPTPAVAGFLAASFPADGGWCRGGSPSTCLSGGFAVAFGGTGVVTDHALDVVSGLLDGSAADTAAPVLAEPFVTALDLSPVYVGEPPSAPVACVDRDGSRGARWLATYDATLGTLGAALDLVGGAGGYDAGVARGACVGFGAVTEGAVVLAVSPAGRHSPPLAVSAAPDMDVAMSGPMRHDGPLTSGGDDGTSTTPGAATTWRFRDAPSGPLVVDDGGATWTVGAASASVTLTRRPDGTAAFAGVVRLEGGQLLVAGQIRGEAVLVGDRWELAGRFVADAAEGGFRGTIQTNGTGDGSDDVLTWRIDAQRAG
jgi:putative cell wall-binding protein